MNLSPLLPVPQPSIVPMDHTAFKGIAEWEQANVLATANHTFFGLNMSQHPHAPLKINQLLNATQPTRVIEIGAGHGGLTVLLALYSITTGCALHSFDKTAGKHADLLRSLGRAVVLKDVLEDAENVEYVKSLIAAPGRVLLIADAGKAIEFNLYAPSMKVGDMIMMHDFSPTPETFERDIKGKVWGWHEAWYARVSDTCRACNIVHTPYLNDVVWSLGYRTS
jgi:cephalosporin hydroxylase